MSVAFLQQAGDATTQTTYTFASQNFGTAAADRYLICALTSRASDGGARTLSSVTIGGVAATISVQHNNSGNNASIAIAAVPTGTTGTVVVVFSDSMGECNIALYTTNNLVSITATDTGTSAADPSTYALDVADEGFAIGIGRSDVGTSTATWTNLNEDFDGATADGNDYTTASASFSTTQTNLAITCDWSDAPTRPVFAVASFEIEKNITVSVSVIVANSSVQAPTITGGATVTPAVIVGNASVQDPTVSTPADDWTNPTKNTGAWVNDTKN